MLELPKSPTSLVTTNIAANSSTLGTAVTTGGTSSTKGTAVECISAANNVRENYGIRVFVYGIAAANTASDTAVDILIGGATDDILIPNLLAGYASALSGMRSWYFPIHVPGGVRIAAQAAGEVVSTAIRVGVALYGGSPPPHRVGRKVTTYGMATVPKGTTITPGGTGAAGAKTQMTASTTEDHFAFLPSFQPDDSTLGAKFVTVTLGVGAATEDMLPERWLYSWDGNENVAGSFPDTPCYREVPSGTRLTMAASASAAADAAHNAVIHAVS